ncbi:MAG TPA: SRPBCC family protein [Chloroflexia bacterium]|nr:SRPBCC family protein [Chloroflexia bacterium]
MRISHKVVIRQPVELVFSYVTNFKLTARWTAEVEETQALAAEPVKVGFIFRQNTNFTFLKLALSHTYQVIEYTPNQSCLFKSIAGLLTCLVQYRFEPHPEGTIFTQEVRSNLEDYFEGKAEALQAERLGRLQSDLASLKALLENIPLTRC